MADQGCSLSTTSELPSLFGCVCVLQIVVHLIICNNRLGMAASIVSILPTEALKEILIKMVSHPQDMLSLAQTCQIMRVSY
jgi:hypothetical protein